MPFSTPFQDEPQTTRHAKDKSWLAVMIWIAVLGLPNLAAVFLTNDSWGSLRVWVAGTLSIVFLLLVTARRASLVAALLAPLVFLVPAAIAFLWITRSLPTATAFSILTGALAEQMSLYLFEIVAACVVGGLLTWALLRMRGQLQEGLLTLRRSRVARVTGVVMILTLLFFAAQLYRRLGPGNAVWQTVDTFRMAYPLGTIGEAGQAWYDFRIVKKRAEARRSIVISSAAPALRADSREIVVLVVGESARFKSFGINGYERPTTPVLESTPNLLNFTDVTTQGVLTMHSVPMLLTGSSAPEIGNAASRASLVSVFSKAGYHVSWMSTHPEVGPMAAASAMYSVEADDVLFLSNYYENKDGDLLPELDRALARKDRRTFVVIHTLGSHWEYVSRYPAESAPFPTKVKKGDVASRFSRPEVLADFTNAYDNTIAYTDWFLGQVIERLKKENCSSLFCYISDHGENAADAPRFPFGHGTLTSDVVHVPMFMWGSDQYRSAHPEDWRVLAANQGRCASTENIFHSLVDALDITCSLAAPAKSLANPKFVEIPRKVLALDGSIHDYKVMIRPEKNLNQLSTAAR